jgi:hypothetical protein
VIYKNEVLKSCLFKLTFICLSASIVFAYSGGSGTSGDPYQIASKDDLLALAAVPADYNKCFILTADINMAGQVFTTAIIAPTSSNIYFQGTAFTGVFDGNSNKITNFTINGGSNSYLGLFGQVGASSALVIKNLGIENFSISGSSSSECVGGLAGQSDGGNIINCYTAGTISGSASFVGGLVGYSYGTITNCHATGTVSGISALGGLVGYIDRGGNITNCYSTSAVNSSNSSQYVGGLAGYNYSGSITNCCSTGAVSSTGSSVGGLLGYNYTGNITNCYSTSSVSGSGIVGGLVGYNYYGSGNITSCYSTGAVSRTGPFSNFGGLVGYNHGIISNCYSTSSVSGNKYVGGLVGSNYNTISNCYSTGTASGSSNVGGLVGYSSGGSASNSFWDVNSSGLTTSASGTGKTTAQMKTLSTFTGWDFTSVWNIAQGTYPFLKKWNYSGGAGTPDAP